MNISVFGLGYVGTVSAACLAQGGHRVIGVDVAHVKVDLINQGQTPIIEAEIGDIIHDTVQSGRLLATMDARWAIEETDMAIVCVGTPSLPNGALDTSYVEKVTAEIGGLIRARTKPFLFVLRSTVLPNTIDSRIIPLLEECSGREIGDGYDVLFHPEFLREGTAVSDYYDPPKIIVGERAPGAGQPVFDLYAGIEAPCFATSIRVAETVKYVDNAFHAVKITFANEIGQFCKAHAVDSRQVMDIFRADTKLNISTKYLKPGFAFGGSCLPKDLRALMYAARSRDVSLPMLGNVLNSNKALVERVLRMILEQDARSVGLVGLSFKPGTDDLRESPLIELAERLIGKGLQVRAYDQDVNLSRLVGKNKAYVEERLPHISRNIVTSLDGLCDSEVIVIGHPIASSQITAWLKQGKAVVDLVGIGDNGCYSSYSGVAW